MQHAIKLTLENYDACVALEKNKRPTFVVHNRGKAYVLETYGWRSLVGNRRVQNGILINSLNKEASEVLKKIIKETASMLL